MITSKKQFNNIFENNLIVNHQQNYDYIQGRQFTSSKCKDYQKKTNFKSFIKMDDIQFE